MLNVGMKDRFHIGRLFSWRVEWHVVVIALNIYFATCCAAIAEPSALKAPLIPPRYERAEILNGGLQCDKPGTEKGVDVIGPHGGVGIDGTNLGKDSGTERGTGCGTTRLEVVAPRNIANKGGADNSGSNSPEVVDYDFEHLLFIFLGAAWLSWFMNRLCRDPYGGLKHNDQAKGRRAFAASSDRRERP